MLKVFKKNDHYVRIVTSVVLKAVDLFSYVIISLKFLYFDRPTLSFTNVV